MSTKVESYLPPQDVEIEAVVLGAAILDNPGLQVLMQAIKEEKVFYNEKHRIIFKAIKVLYDLGESVDMMTVVNEVRKLGSEGEKVTAYDVGKLTDRVNSSANIESHIRIVYEHYIKRCQIEFGYFLIKRAKDLTMDPFDTLDKMQLGLDKLRHGFLTNPIKTTGEIIPQLTQRLENLMSGTVTLNVPSPIQNLDKITGGWKPSALIVIAARPGMGKSSFMTENLRTLAHYNMPAGVFSLEMSELEIVSKIVVGEYDHLYRGNLSNNRFDKGPIEPEELVAINSLISGFKQSQIVIDDTAGISMSELRSKAITMVSKHNIKILFIDYLQLISTHDNKSVGNREQEIAFIARSLKNLAKELDIPIVALSQLSREVEKRSSKRPQLSDLRESGEIEQAADVVGLLYRPEYYGITETLSGASTVNYAEFIIAKHRSGSVTDVPYYYRGATNRITDIDTYFMPVSSEEKVEAPPF